MKGGIARLGPISTCLPGSAPLQQEILEPEQTREGPLKALALGLLPGFRSPETAVSAIARNPAVAPSYHRVRIRG